MRRLAAILLLALFVGVAPRATALAQIVPGPPNPVVLQNAYKNITTDTTTTVKAGSGLLHAVCVNTVAATETITIYDNTAASGTKIGTITAATYGCDVFDVAFTTGLTLVTATAAGDITVSYQ